ncbi:helix-turn-helix domain-containing protein [uncultured Bilophila sp.]|uniref:helix-turn-helix domain-containing protein n=1 Tax=uncultured Bilophila sp. TaxID=529385 RepID=UPI0026DD164A|nr:helix-turn-helix transcriptional regulator [uncultured Bilophila sp.]
MLREKRRLRGLSQAGLAVKSGRSLRCVQYLEAGTQEPTLSTLYALAHALDVGVTDLIDSLPEELNNVYR